MARVLVACEFSGVVRNAFLARGHDAWSCDLLPAEDGSERHITGDARNHLHEGWDLIVAHPPCTRLCNSGVRWLSAPPPGRTRAEMWADLDAAADLFSAFWGAPVKRVCIENPVMHRHAKARIRGVPAARPVGAAVAVRARRKQAHLLLAARADAVAANRDCRGARTARGPAAAGAGPVEGALALFPGHRPRDGGAMGVKHG